MFEDDAKSVLFILGLILMLACHSWSQEICRSCPSDLDSQFPLPAPTKQEMRVTWTKAFAIPHFVIAPAAIAFDETATLEGQKRGRCVECGLSGVPERVGFKELFAVDAVTWGAETGMEWMFAKALKHGSRKDQRIFAALPYVMTGPQTFMHIRGGYNWLSRCY